MRTLLFVFLLVSAVSVPAQSPVVRPLFNQGTVFAKAGEFEKALASYRTALKMSENGENNVNFLARLRYNLGVCEFHLGRWETAVSEYRKAIELRGGDYAEAFYALGMAETARKSWPQARDAFLGALKHNKKNGEAWFDLGFAYVSERNFEQAEIAFRKAIALRSIDTPLSHNNVGVILAMRGDMTAAKYEFDLAYRLSAGRLKMAESNRRFCERYEQTGDLLASQLKIIYRNDN